MASDTLPQISSLAAPTEEDRAALRAMSTEERRALVAAHIEKGRQSIREGRYVEFEDEDDVRAYFRDRLAKYEDIAD